ncbi:MAG: ATP-binding cassette domain-containing protein [Cytophagaceae bacterium]
MEIITDKLGKRFNRNWLFKNVSLKFSSGNSYAITGYNGSGKSTFLKILSGMIPSSSGRINYLQNDKAIDPDQFYRYISYLAPYQELIEEFTLTEFLNFHFSFKQITPGISINEIISRLKLQKSAEKEIQHFSSGMKQRVKLATIFFSNTPVIFLDEPTMNLDSEGIAWYKSEIENLPSDRLILISSNQKYEYDFCQNIINITDYHLL